MHKLLERQIKKLKRKSADGSLPVEKLLEVISQTYEESDEERRKNERSMKLMSEEVMALNKQIQEESETYVSTITGSVIDGIITFCHKGLVQSINESAEHIFKITSDEKQGSSINEFTTDGEPSFLEIFDSHFDGQSDPSPMETFAQDQEGRIFPIDLSISKIETSGEAVYIAIVRDISTRKEFQRALITAKEEAERMATAKTNFLSNMSHEIRTPMNAVIGLTNILLQEEPRQDQIDSLKALKFSGENLLVLINDILDYNKIESGKLEFEKIDFGLKDIVQSINKGLGVKAEKKKIKLDFVLGQGVPRVIMGDPTRLTQILNNLVGNAIKFTEKGSVTLDIQLEEKVNDDLWLNFRVIDTGIGIPEDKLDHIFESFTQTNSTITRKYGGTGLGLAITKRLLELQGSEIKVSSKEDVGSTFYFTLKVGVSKKKVKDLHNLAEEEGLLRTFNGEKILLVEDNKVNQIVASRFLKKWGLSMDIADNGKIATELVQENEYMLVLMDLQMPEMDGYTATKVIRQMDGEKFEKLPIIALTASALALTRIKVKETGMDGHVSKPFKPVELNHKIAKFLHGDRRTVE
ncbi:MAG: ATP-binding protein [Bacteroidota bacterium]